MSLWERERKRAMLAKEKAAEYAKRKVAQMYPEDDPRRKEAERRFAADEYRKLMYP